MAAQPLLQVLDQVRDHLLDPDDLPGRYVVAENDTRVLVNHGSEILRLQACHPRFFATHRYLVDAKLVGVTPPHGRFNRPVTSAYA